VNASAFVFASDLADEGVEQVFENIQRAGLDGVLAAFAYHEARDVFPHNPARRVHFLEPGALYFRPTPRFWRDVPFDPVVSSLAADPDPLGAARRESERRGLALHAWTVFLHTDRREAALEPYVCRNAFGDAYLTELCPANEGARAYARALAADVAAQGVDSILSESLHYHPLEHGFHHERYFLELGPRTRFLLGLCFCASCRECAQADGVDARALAHWVGVEIDAVFAGGSQSSEELDREQLAAEAGGELGGYLGMREEAVRSLAAEVTAVTRDGGSQFDFLDLSGGVKGYASGQPEGGPAASMAWQLGIDVASVAAACDGLGAVGYAADPDRLRLDLETYRDLIGQARLTVAMRPTAPDCDSARNLADKLRVARAVGAERVDFYHYGLAPLSALDLVQDALASV
jgi:hypothetical protein